MADTVNSLLKVYIISVNMVYYKDPSKANYIQKKQKGDNIFACLVVCCVSNMPNKTTGQTSLRLLENPKIFTSTHTKCPDTLYAEKRTTCVSNFLICLTTLNINNKKTL